MPLPPKKSKSATEPNVWAPTFVPQKEEAAKESEKEPNVWAKTFVPQAAGQVEEEGTTKKSNTKPKEPNPWASTFVPSEQQQPAAEPSPQHKQRAYYIIFDGSFLLTGWRKKFDGARLTARHIVKVLLPFLVRLLAEEGEQVIYSADFFDGDPDDWLHMTKGDINSEDWPRFCLERDERECCHRELGEAGVRVHTQTFKRQTTTEGATGVQHVGWVQKGTDASIAYRMGSASKGSKIVLLAGDGDFAAAIRQCPEAGKEVIVAGFRGMVSRDLQQAATQCVFLEDHDVIGTWLSAANGS